MGIQVSISNSPPVRYTRWGTAASAPSCPFPSREFRCTSEFSFPTAIAADRTAKQLAVVGIRQLSGLNRHRAACAVVNRPGYPVLSASRLVFLRHIGTAAVVTVGGLSGRQRSGITARLTGRVFWPTLDLQNRPWKCPIYGHFFAVFGNDLTRTAFPRFLGVHPAPECPTGLAAKQLGFRGRFAISPARNALLTGEARSMYVLNIRLLRHSKALMKKTKVSHPLDFRKSPGAHRQHFPPRTLRRDAHAGAVGHRPIVDLTNRPPPLAGVGSRRCRLRCMAISISGKARARKCGPWASGSCLWTVMRHSRRTAARDRRGCRRPNLARGGGRGAAAGRD